MQEITHGQSKLPKPKVTAFGLVRDRNGKPKIDGDPRLLPDPIKQMMTPDELATAIQEYDNAVG